MDPLTVSLRLLRIVFGMFWAGTALFLALILEPRLRYLGPTVQRPVMGALVPFLAPAMTISSFITIGAGVALALVMRWGRLDTFLSWGWGWAILTGFITSVIAFLLGSGLTSVTAARIGRLAQSIEGRPPDPNEMHDLQRLSYQLELLSRAGAVLVLIAVGAMAVARFI